MVLTRIGLLVALPVLAGCAATVHNLTPANLEIAPSVQTFADPSLAARLGAYETFTVVPLSAFSDSARFRGILERQMLFALRNSFESLGYTFVEPEGEPDFLLLIDGEAPYHEMYVPPSTVTLPKWVPGTTINVHESSRGTLNFRTFGDVNAYGWGSYGGSSTTTVEVPGYLTTQTYTRPGYTTGFFYPTLVVSAFDAKDFANVWLGSAVGTSRNPDIRVSGQMLLDRMAAQFPPCLAASANPPRGSGFIGISCGVLTNDGNNYFPTVLRVEPSSPAATAGIRAFDMIVSIDGTPTANLPFSEAMERLWGDAGTKTTLRIWRTGTQLERVVTRRARR